MTQLPLFFSDLDKTLLFTKSTLKQLGEPLSFAVPVEDHHGKPLSYMDEKAFQAFSANAASRYQIVPVTTRTSEQYARIRFPEAPTVAVIKNGGRIIMDGEELTDWTDFITSEVSSLDVSPAEVHAEILSKFPEHSLEKARLKAIRNVDGCFTYLVGVSRNGNGSEVRKFCAQLAKEAGYVLSEQGRKIYIIPPVISKAKAVAEVQRLLGTDNSSVSFAAGDSILDFPMSDAVTHFLLPAHSDAWDRENPPAFITEHSGLEASRELLEAVEAFLDVE